MRKRVLIVDDNPMNNTLFFEPVQARFLVDITMKMVSAERLIHQYQYDFIVIDVMMPTQDLLCDNEMVAGFVFYRDVIQPKGLSSKIIFWSRLENDSFNAFWPEIPENVFFLHKSRVEDHLVKYLVGLDND